MSDSVRKIAIRIRNPQKALMESLLSGSSHPHHHTPADATHAPTHEPKPEHNAPAPEPAVVLSTRRHREHAEEQQTEQYEVQQQKQEVHHEELKAHAAPHIDRTDRSDRLDRSDDDVPPAAIPLPRLHTPESAISMPEFPLEPLRTVPHIESNAVPMVQTRMSIPKKPIIVEGISASALQVAYFCMEIGIDEALPTYSGGLGILAGDMLKSCADLELRTIGVSLIHRKGYFKQRFDASGWQMEEDVVWNPHEKLILLPNKVLISIEGRSVTVAAWLYKVKGQKGNLNPIIFLDTDVPENSEDDKHITDHLYSGDAHHRLIQESVLGIAGMRMLTSIGATNIEKYHMNEGHAALLTLELYRAYAACDDPLLEVQNRAVFTTHTPVAAGHDVFGEDIVRSVLGVHYIPSAIESVVFEGGNLNMTKLGFHFSAFINGVAKRHGEVTRELFPGYRIESITNGVHVGRWISEPFAKLYDRYLPSWRSDPYSLRYALSIPQGELWMAHEEAKRALIEYINQKYHTDLSQDAFTIGFARRAATYKRADLLLRDIGRLSRIAEKSRGIQIIYGGKAHPQDRDGKLLVQRIIGTTKHLGVASGKIKCVYLEDYDMEMARRLVAGVDIWLNTPIRPQEASGTSGMKAALNGVPHFSVLDGWWLEGNIEGVTGWSIGPHPEGMQNVGGDAEDAEDMYTKLEYVIIPRYENERGEWVKIMRQAIAVNGSFFNTHRMVEQYVLGAYFK